MKKYDHNPKKGYHAETQWSLTNEDLYNIVLEHLIAKGEIKAEDKGRMSMVIDTYGYETDNETTAASLFLQVKKDLP